MKSVACRQCGQSEVAATEKEALLKMESHMRNAHGAHKSAEVKKMMKGASASLRDVPTM